MFTSVAAVSDDVQLLTLEIATLWPRREPAGRAHDEPQPPLVIAAANHGLAAVPGPDVPIELAARLVRMVADAPSPESPSAPEPSSLELGHPPAILESCRGLLAEQFGPLVTAGGPSYVIDSLATDPPPTLGGFTSTVVSSESGHLDRAPACPESWEPAEWTALLTGDLGPWAIALAEDESVLAVCHTPVWSDRAAEAGVWTRPDARGQGHAARVTAVWARLTAHRERVLFDSTWADNHSSQRVAARLGLRPIGWLWKLRQGQ